MTPPSHPILPVHLGLGPDRCPKARRCGAWLESETGERTPLGASCLLGRSSRCDLTLDDPRVSRSHVVINGRGDEAFWLSHLSKVNGTRVNGMCVSQPVRLRRGDEILIGPFQFTFQALTGKSTESTLQIGTQQTHVDLCQERRWLLVGDIEDSTGLASRLEPAAYRRSVDAWFARSRKAIESNRGGINKFLGDGFVGCWPDAGGVSDRVAAALDTFEQMRDALPFRFRIVLHVGDVLVGGLGTMGEESLSGPDVNFAFRMEKVAGARKTGLLLSEPAALALAGHFDPGMPCRSAVPGFDGAYTFFVPADSNRRRLPAVNTFSAIAAGPVS